MAGMFYRQRWVVVFCSPLVSALQVFGLKTLLFHFSNENKQAGNNWLCHGVVGFNEPESARANGSPAAFFAGIFFS
jgi:hypothetical protein